MGPPKEVRPRRVETQRTSRNDPGYWLDSASSAAICPGSLKICRRHFHLRLSHGDSHWSDICHF